MPTYRLTLEYDGGAFHGWQRQPGLRTVEGELRQALRPLSGAEPELTAASRTDAGAHAHGQVVGVRLDRDWLPDTLQRALSALLPRDIAVSEVSRAPEGFHARHDALRRTYRYLVVPRRVPVARRFAWEVSGQLDLDAMRAAVTLFRGRHDFGAFGRSPRPAGSTVRTVHQVSVRVVTGLGGGQHFSAVVIEVTADAFLHGMMRALAGALVEVGRGRLTRDELAAALRGPSGAADRLTIAPAHGLHQWSVAYAPAVEAEG
ncbi:MAG TPA: tRNA pseudouridine(38-40) synthase TruA [Candidatus Binatia bacterium]|nr:tRNA pseudouridine(38-40) synthase TruA [Candidatus Binatia bacterium]